MDVVRTFGKLKQPYALKFMHIVKIFGWFKFSTNENIHELVMKIFLLTYWGTGNYAVHLNNCRIIRRIDLECFVLNGVGLYLYLASKRVIQSISVCTDVALFLQEAMKLSIFHWQGYIFKNIQITQCSS